MLSLAKPSCTCFDLDLLNTSLQPYPFRGLNSRHCTLWKPMDGSAAAAAPNLAVTFNRATRRQRLTHITEELKLLSESDKDWIMGRSSVARLNHPLRT